MPRRRYDGLAHPGVEKYGDFATFLKVGLESLNERIAAFFGLPVIEDIALQIRQPGDPRDEYSSATAEVDDWGGPRLSFSPTWVPGFQHPLEVVAHEIAHVYARNAGEGTPYEAGTSPTGGTKWLHEGIADWVAEQVLANIEPGYEPKTMPYRGFPTEGYGATRRFLDWLEAKNPGSVKSLVRMVSTGKYTRGPRGTWWILWDGSLERLATSYYREYSAAVHPHRGGLMSGRAAGGNLLGRLENFFARMERRYPELAAQTARAIERQAPELSGAVNAGRRTAQEANARVGHLVREGL